MIPYAKHSLTSYDIEAATSVLRNGALTGGPQVPLLEATVEAALNVKAVAMSSGAGALHAAMVALEIGPGDEVITTPLTFASTVHCIEYVGATPVLADVEPDTLCLDPAAVEKLITPRTKAIITMDYAGQVCDYGAFRQLAEKHNLKVVADACHSLGAWLDGEPVGALADITVFSFHPAKLIVCGEGGMAVTKYEELAERMRTFRNRGMVRTPGSWRYDIVEAGYNYLMPEANAALVNSQWGRLHNLVRRRAAIAEYYHEKLADLPGLVLPAVKRGGHAWHIFVVRLPSTTWRDGFMDALKVEGIGTQVHYIPIHYHSHFQRLARRLPVAEGAFERMVTIPLFPTMGQNEIDEVVAAMHKVYSSFETRHV